MKHAHSHISFSIRSAKDEKFAKNLLWESCSTKWEFLTRHTRFVEWALFLALTKLLSSSCLSRYTLNLAKYPVFHLFLERTIQISQTDYSLVTVFVAVSLRCPFLFVFCNFRESLSESSLSREWAGATFTTLGLSPGVSFLCNCYLTWHRLQGVYSPNQKHTAERLQVDVSFLMMFCNHKFTEVYHPFCFFILLSAVVGFLSRTNAIQKITLLLDKVGGRPFIT